jgi:hypothetical protein
MARSRASALGRSSSPALGDATGPCDGLLARADDGTAVSRAGSARTHIDPFGAVELCRRAATWLSRPGLAARARAREAPPSPPRRGREERGAGRARS